VCLNVRILDEDCQDFVDRAELPSGRKPMERIENHLRRTSAACFGVQLITVRRKDQCRKERRKLPGHRRSACHL
jgi:hypothetical protein